MTEQNHIPTQEPVETPLFSIHDILKLMLSNWYWFVLSVTLCVGCAYLYIASTQKVYNRTATILVKDSRKGGDSDLATFTDLTGFSARRNVDNEIYILQSRRLMEEVVRQLNLTINYTTRAGLRTRTLYRQTPIEAEFINANNYEGLAFSVLLEGGNQISLSDFQRRDITSVESDQVIQGRLGDTLSTPVGRLVIKPTFYFSEQYAGREIQVKKSPLNLCTAAYRSAVQSSVVNKMSSIITLSMRDVVPQRAEDVINSLIAAYNNDAVEDKRAVAKQTASFIANRLGIISQELGDVDQDIQEFKRSNNIYDLS
ncbi:MAG: chromosome partitioning protein ParA, partial [Alistipes sp.]|nr:chromosome partitioning protein ParA [Alistipes sp.]